jgi:hypothetical protein
MKKYINGILSLASVCILFYLILDLREQVQTHKDEKAILIKRVDNLTKQIDSMRVVGGFDSCKD